MDYEEFTKTAFKFIVKSGNYKKLKYIRLKIHKGNANMHGLCFRCTIMIFIDKILLAKVNDSEDDIKAYIIFVIAHELSHSLQIINSVRYGDDMKYRYFIEASADLDASTYIKENYEILEKRLGYFSLDTIESIEDKAIEYLKKSTVKYRIKHIR